MLCRSLVRNSKSEDQLSYDELNAHESDEDQLNSSCHTLLDSAHTPAMPNHSMVHNTKHSVPPFVSSESSSSRSAGSSSKGSSGEQLLSGSQVPPVSPPQPYILFCPYFSPVTRPPAQTFPPPASSPAPSTTMGSLSWTTCLLSLPAVLRLPSGL